MVLNFKQACPFLSVLLDLRKKLDIAGNWFLFFFLKFLWNFQEFWTNSNHVLSSELQRAIPKVQPLVPM